MRILLVDDDENLMDLLAERLIQQRYAVDIAVDGSSAQTYLDLFDYDLLVLDLMLPDGDGIEFAKRFRAEGYDNPLMILTAKESTAEKVKALDAGADDYVVKPFDFDELCARIRALLRRENKGLPTVLSWGALQLDPSACKTTYKGNPVRLTPKEFSMMELFLRHPYRVYSLGAIIDDLWSFEDPPGEDAVRTHIKGLRRKLKAAGAPKDLIKTVYGLGYQLNESIVENESKEENQSRENPRRSSQVQTDAEHSDIEPPTALGQAALGQAALGQTGGPSESSVLNQRLTEAYSRYLWSVSEQLETLNHLVRALADGHLTLGLHQQSLAIAHNLSGSLGSFGFAEGSQIARSLEEQLKSLPVEPPTDADAMQTSHSSAHLDSDLDLNLQIADSQATDQISAQLSQSVYQLRQLTKQAEIAASADLLSNTVQSGFPVLLIVSQDDEFAQQLAAIAAQAQLQTQQVKTLRQASAHLSTARCDLLLIDADKIDADKAVSRGFDHASSDEMRTLAALDSQTIGLPDETMRLITQFKRDYHLPVMVTAHPLNLKHRLSLIKQGIDVVSDRTTEPLQIALAAAGMIRLEGQQGRVAIADDDPDMLALFKASLEPWGFQIIPFESAIALWHWLDRDLNKDLTPSLTSNLNTGPLNTGPLNTGPLNTGPFNTGPLNTGLKQRAQQQPLGQLPIDILVLDIEMPTFSGLELCQVIRADARFQSIPILFLTKYQEIALRTQAYQAGGDDFIHKAVAPAELAVRLRNQLKRACRLQASKPS